MSNLSSIFLVSSSNISETFLYYMVYKDFYFFWIEIGFPVVVIDD